MFDKNKKITILVESPDILKAKLNEGDSTNMSLKNTNTEINDYILDKFSKYVDDNIYFKKYLSIIINANIAADKAHGHHVIPVAIYKIENKLKKRWDAIKSANNDENNFTVELDYKNHILAHYYLALCAKKANFRFCCEDALFWMTSNKEKILPEEEELIKNLPEYERLNIDWRNNMRQKRTGRSSGTKGKKSIYNPELRVKKYVSEDLLQEYLNNGWVMGGPPQSEETKRKIGENSRKCLTGSHRSEEAKRKTSETLKRNYQDPNSGNSIARRKLTEKYKGKKRDRAIVEKILATKYAKNNGKYCSEETLRKMSLGQKGKPKKRKSINV